MPSRCRIGADTITCRLVHTIRYGDPQRELVAPKLEANEKLHVWIHHDESTVHAKEQVASVWTLPGENAIRLKSDGRLIHVSSFILEASEVTGRLVLNDDQWADQLLRPEQERLPRDAAVLLNAGSAYEGKL